MTRLEMLAAKLYCIRTAGNYNYPADLDDLIKEMGKVVASIPFNSSSEDTTDKAKFIAVSRGDLEYILKSLEDSLRTPTDELLPSSVEASVEILNAILQPS